MSGARQKRLDKAQMRVLFTCPFFAPGVAKLPVEWDEKVETACTDGQKIVWGTKFFDGLSDQELVTVLVHEVSHCMLGHLWRAPGGCDWERWNVACDHAVNLMLKEFSAGVMAKRLADPFPFPDPQDAYCADPAFVALAEEVIYQKLSAKPKNPGGNGGNPGSGASAQAGGSSGKGNPAKVPQKGNSAPNPKPGPGSMPSFGQMEAPKPGASSSGKRLRNDWEGTLIQACQMASGRGELPAGMSRFVDHLLKPAVDWWDLLRAFLREQCHDDYDWLRPDPLFDESGFILPSLNSEKIGPVVFATDTSGSINQELLARFQTEKQACLDELHPASLVDIYCDSKIHKVAEYRPGEVIGKDAPGGGGTAFEPVWEHVGKMAIAPKCIVYLTDLDGSFGADPGVPVLWVVFGSSNNKPPFGEVIKCDTN